MLEEQKMLVVNNIGLVKAAIRYGEGRGKFSIFATIVMENEIIQ